MRTKPYKLILVFCFTLILTCLLLVNAQAQEAKFVDTTYKISFQPPSGSISEADSTSIANYKGKESLYSSAAVFYLTSPDLESSTFSLMSTLMTTDSGIKTMSDILIKGLNGKSFDEAHLIESSKINVAGFDGMQMTMSLKKNGISMKGRMVALPLNEQNRLYIFIYGCLPTQFDKWSKASDEAINSFTIVRPDKSKWDDVKATLSTGEASATEIAFWETIRNSDNPDDFKAYIDKYPKGAFVELAKIRFEAKKKKN